MNTDDPQANGQQQAAMRWILAISVTTAVFVYGIIFIWYRSHLLDASLGIGGLLIGGGVINLIVELVVKPKANHLSLYRRLYLPWAGLTVIALVYGLGYENLIRQLGDTKIALTTYREIVNRDIELPYRGGTPQTLQRFLLGPAKARKVWILGINATGLLHGYRAQLKRIIANGGHVKILLLNPMSETFADREQFERSKKSGRLLKEWATSKAIIDDIINQLRVNNYTPRELESRLKIRLHSECPRRSILYVDRDEEITKGDKSTTVQKEYILLNRYPDWKCPKNDADSGEDESVDVKKELRAAVAPLRRLLGAQPDPPLAEERHGQVSLSLLVDPTWIEFNENYSYFDDQWKKADCRLDLEGNAFVPLNKKKSTPVCPGENDRSSAPSSETIDPPSSSAKVGATGKHSSAIVQAILNLESSTRWCEFKKTDLNFPTYHPQGLVKIGDHFFLSSVEIDVKPDDSTIRTRTGHSSPAGMGVGHIFKFSAEGNLVEETELGEGLIYHPGGIDYDGEFIWVPVAEYRPRSNSIIYRINTANLESKEVFRIDDHIGAVVSARPSKSLYGLNWGGRTLYSWPLDVHNNLLEDPALFKVKRTDGSRLDLGAKPTKALPVPTNNPFFEYQDCKFVRDRYMLCAGVNSYCLLSERKRAEQQQSSGACLRPEGDPDTGPTKISFGGLDLFDLKEKKSHYRIPVPLWVDERPDLVMTNNPFFFELRGERLRFYFVPEDDQSSLYIFDTYGAQEKCPAVK